MKWFVASGDACVRGLPFSHVKSAKENGSARCFVESVPQIGCWASSGLARKIQGIAATHRSRRFFMASICATPNGVQVKRTKISRHFHGLPATIHGIFMTPDEKGKLTGCQRAPGRMRFRA